MTIHDQIFKYFELLEFNPNPNKFDDRKKIQKIVYLLKHLGISVNIEYNWYIYGPYSPELTDIIFDVFERNKKINTNKTSINDIDQRKIDKLNSSIQNNNLSSNDLELMASFAFLVDKLNLEKSKLVEYKLDLKKFVKEKKPHFKDDELKRAWNYYITLGKNHSNNI